MTRKDGVLMKGFIVFVLLLLFGVVVTVYTQRVTSPPARAAFPVSEVIPSPIAAPKPPKVTTSDVHSSKADKKLVLLGATSTSGETRYNVIVTDISGGNELPLLTKTLSAGSSMSLPFNAWDPTDTYVFIGEKVGSVSNYYVLKANGQSFADGQKSIDVGAVWTDKKIGYTIREATGWASGTLLIIYTTKDDGSRGPAFWFEIPSTAIIQLAG